MKAALRWLGYVVCWLAVLIIAAWIGVIIIGILSVKS